MKPKKLPTTERALLIASLRLVDRTSGLLNDLDAAIGHLTEAKKLRLRDADKLHRLLRHRFNRLSGVGLFIAADNMRLNLPKDLRGEP